ncbi:hypothetical protein [Gordonibacter sp.]|uniref:hypothetical protein n=1 Tax=Gordonibacter sp. TaxID=1968902 RepID=UPI002FC8F3FF
MVVSSEKEQRSLVVRAKLAQPVLPSGYVSRRGPLEKLDILAQQKLTLIGAPMGYGKTALMVEFAQEKSAEGCLVSWLAIDEKDVDLVRFFRHVVAALGGFDEELAVGMEAASEGLGLWSGPKRGEDAVVVIGNLLFEALPFGKPCYLLIDDYGCPEQRGIDELLLRLCLSTPSDFHVVFASSTFSWALQSDACRLGFGCLVAEDLAVTFDEARQMMQAACDESPSDEALAKAHECVEGWPQGLMLVARTLSGARSAHDVRLDGSLVGVRRYFEVHIARRVSGDLLSFMLEASVFSAPV